MKNFIITLFVFFLISSANAQSKTEKTAYYFIPQVALLNGDNATSAQVQMTGGIQKKNWMLGIGTAIDYYKVRTVPMFADLRFCFGKNRAIFSYLDLGTDIVWPLESQNNYRWDGNGLYNDIGIGYAFGGQKKKSIVVSMGYSVKKVAESYKEIIYREFPPYGGESYERRLDYTLNRLVLRLGIKL